MKSIPLPLSPVSLRSFNLLCLILCTILFSTSCSWIFGSDDEVVEVNQEENAIEDESEDNSESLNESDPEAEAKTEAKTESEEKIPSPQPTSSAIKSPAIKSPKKPGAVTNASNDSQDKKIDCNSPPTSVCCLALIPVCNECKERSAQALERWKIQCKK